VRFYNLQQQPQPQYGKQFFVVIRKNSAFFSNRNGNRKLLYSHINSSKTDSALRCVDDLWKQISL